MTIWATYSLNEEVVTEFTSASHFHGAPKLQTMLSALLQLNSVKYWSPDPKLFPPKVRLGKAYLIDIAWCHNLQTCLYTNNMAEFTSGTLRFPYKCEDY